LIRLLMDENVPRHSVTLLRRAGVDVSVVRSGVDDESVMAEAVAERRILVTLDRDFGKLAFSHGVVPPLGVVLLRLRSLRPETCGKALLALLRNTTVVLEGRFTTVREAGHRQRLLRSYQ
jgi:predicted nuclease of predicted toxin-antitoxin system